MGVKSEGHEATNHSENKNKLGLRPTQLPKGRKDYIMSNITTNTNNTRTATYFTFNHFDKKIVGSELNFKKSENPNNPQYKALMNAMAAHPNYELSAVAPKVKKQTYAGLTTDLMREYVKIKGTAAQLEELDNLIDNNEAYPTIKSWFLDYFKCGFTVEKAKEQIARHKLNARKAKVRVKVAPAAVLEMPTAQNF